LGAAQTRRKGNNWCQFHFLHSSLLSRNPHHVARNYSKSKFKFYLNRWAGYSTFSFI
jgi:hypothetical protein